MAEDVLKRRFIHTSWSKWDGLSVEQQKQYDNSIVFIKEDQVNGVDTGKGVAIYTQGHLFEMSNEADVKGIIESYLKAGGNVSIVSGTGENEGKLVISATDTTYGATDGITLDTATNTFKHTNSVTAKTVAGGETVTLSSTDKDFKYDQFTYDAQGHITGVTERTVTLPDTAFTDANTTYDLDATVNATKGVDVNLKGNDSTTDTVTFVGGDNVSVSLNGNGEVEISSSYENDNTTYTGKEAIKVAQPEGENTIGEISLKIDKSDLFLSQSDEGLKANIKVEYDSATNFIYLKGVGAADKTTTGFDASAFVKDSFVESVTYVDQDDNGRTGKFLKFVFVVVDQYGQKEFEKTTTYVDVTELINTIYDVEGDATTYSVVEETTKNDGTVLFTVKNTLGKISRDNDSNVITISTSEKGLATVDDIKNVIESISSVAGADSTVAGEGEVTVVTAVSQEKGRVEVTTGAAATKTYVDEAIEGAEGSVTLTNGEKGSYVFAEGKAGYVTAEHMAEIMTLAWSWGSIE